jgi:hypothetical protein
MIILLFPLGGGTDNKHYIRTVPIFPFPAGGEFKLFHYPAGGELSFSRYIQINPDLSLDLI